MTEKDKEEDEISFEMGEHHEEALLAASGTEHKLVIEGEVKDNKIFISDLKVQFLHNWMDSKT